MAKGGKIDLITLAFNLQSNSDKILNDAVQKLYEIQKNSNIELDINSKNAQKELRKLTNDLNRLKDVDIGNVSLDFLKELDPTKGFDVNDNAFKRYSEMVSNIASLPDDLLKKLSGYKDIDWNQIFYVDDNLLKKQASDINQYVVDEEEAWNKIVKLKEKRDSLKKESMKLTKKSFSGGLTADEAKQQTNLEKEIGDVNKQIVGFTTRLESLYKQNPSGENPLLPLIEGLKNYRLEYDKIKNLEGILPDNLTSKEAQAELNNINAMLEAIRNIRPDAKTAFDSFRFDEIEKNIDAFISRADKENALKARFGVELTDSEIKAIVEKVQAVFNEHKFLTKLDVSEEQIQQLMERINGIIESSPGIKIKIDESELSSAIRTLLTGGEISTGGKTTTVTTTKPIETDFVKFLKSDETRYNNFINDYTNDINKILTNRKMKPIDTSFINTVFEREFEKLFKGVTFDNIDLSKLSLKLSEAVFNQNAKTITKDLNGLASKYFQEFKSQKPEVTKTESQNTNVPEHTTNVFTNLQNVVDKLSSSVEELSNAISNFTKDVSEKDDNTASDLQQKLVGALEQFKDSLVKSSEDEKQVSSISESFSSLSKSIDNLASKFKEDTPDDEKKYIGDVSTILGKISETIGSLDATIASLKDATPKENTNVSLGVLHKEVSSLVASLNEGLSDKPVKLTFKALKTEIRNLVSNISEEIKAQPVKVSLDTTKGAVSKLNSSINAKLKETHVTPTLDISENEVRAFINKLQSVFDAKGIKVKIDTSDSAIRKTTKKANSDISYKSLVRDGFSSSYSNELFSEVSKISTEKIQPNSILDILHKINQSEIQHSKVYGRDTNVEHGFYFDSKTGRHTNPFDYGLNDDVGHLDASIKAYVKERVGNSAKDLDTFFHSHAQEKMAFSPNDLIAAKNDRGKMQNLQRLVGMSLNEVSVLDISKMSDAVIEAIANEYNKAWEKASSNFKYKAEPKTLDLLQSSSKLPFLFRDLKDPLNSYRYDDDDTIAELFAILQGYSKFTDEMGGKKLSSEGFKSYMKMNNLIPEGFRLDDVKIFNDLFSEINNEIAKVISENDNAFQSLGQTAFKNALKKYGYSDALTTYSTKDFFEKNALGLPQNTLDQLKAQENKGGIKVGVDAEYLVNNIQEVIDGHEFKVNATVGNEENATDDISYKSKQRDRRQENINRNNRKRAIKALGKDATEEQIAEYIASHFETNTSKRKPKEEADRLFNQIDKAINAVSPEEQVEKVAEEAFQQFKEKTSKPSVDEQAIKNIASMFSIYSKEEATEFIEEQLNKAKPEKSTTPIDANTLKRIVNMSSGLSAEENNAYIDQQLPTSNVEVIKQETKELEHQNEVIKENTKLKEDGKEQKDAEYRKQAVEALNDYIKKMQRFLSLEKQVRETDENNITQRLLSSYQKAETEYRLSQEKLFSSDKNGIVLADYLDEKAENRLTGLLDSNRYQEIGQRILSLSNDIQTLKTSLDSLNTSNASVDVVGNVYEQLGAKKAELESLLNAVKELNGNDKAGISGKITGMVQDRMSLYKTQINTIRDKMSNPSNEFIDKLNEANNLIDSINAKGGIDVTNPQELSELNEVEAKIRTILDELKTNKGKYELIDQSEIQKSYTAFNNYLNRNSRAYGKLGVQIESIKQQFENLLSAPNGQGNAELFESLKRQVVDFKNTVTEAGLQGQSFGQMVSARFKTLGVYLASFVSFYRVVGYVRQCISAVEELNQKMIELSKVSNTSIRDLESQFNDFKNISIDVGGTISDTIQATADWARNGYSLPDAKELARVAQLYKNVGDGIDINQANESLISTLRGYNLEAKDALSIVDKINSVANTQPIDSGGLGEALQRSAAAFQAANTDLSESIALITASNSVVQNPERVGNMWKTVSARIRGASAELQEMGEDTEGMATSTSKLRDLVKGMTGFDIMRDENTFKSIYEIVLGIGKEWKNLSDVNQAALLEKLAGKTQTNALAAALNNVELLEEAYNTAVNSAGSALEEQSHYEEGIEYHIGQLKASIEGLQHSLLSVDITKWFVDLGTKGVSALDKLTEKFGSLPVLLGVLGAGVSIKNGRNAFADFGLNRINQIHGAVGNIDPNAPWYKKPGSFVSNLFGFGADNKKNLIQRTSNQAMSIYNQIQKEGLEFNSASIDKVTQSMEGLSKQSIVVAQSVAASGKAMDQATAQEEMLATATKAVGSGFANFGKAVAGTAMSIGIALAVSAAVNFAIQKYDEYIHEHENAVKSFNESMDAFKDEEAKVKSLEEQLDSLKAKIRELEGIKNLSFTDQDTLKGYKEQEASLERQLELERARQRLAGNKLRTDSENVLRSRVDTYDSIDAQAFIAGQSRSSYVNSHMGTSGGEFGKQKTDVRTATKNAMKYYDSLSEAYKQVVEDRDELLLKQEDGKEMSKEEKRQLAELEKEVLRYDTEMGDVKQTIIDNYDSIKDLSDAYVLLGDSTSDSAKAVQEDERAIGDWIIATDEATSSTDEATKAQNEFVHAVVKTSKDIADQKTAVDGLAAAYKEIAELTGGDALQNVTLDEEQLAKYGKYLEYVNGAYRLNREELIKNAKANNDLEKTKIELIRKRERDQLIANYKALDRYNELLKDGQKILDGVDLRSHISDLQKENEQILSNCKMYDYQISQIESLSSAYQNWLGASEDFHAESFGEMQSASKFVLDRLADGFTGGEKYEAALDLILPDHVDRDDESAIKKYVKDLQTKYFTEDITGSNRFIKEAYDANLLQYDKETGEYSVTEGTTIEDFQKHFKWTTDVTRAMFNELERSRGWKFYWDIDDLDTVRDDYIETRTELDELLQKKEEFEKTPVGERDQEAFTELLDKIAKTRKELIDLDNVLQKEVVQEVKGNIDENGGVKGLYNQFIESKKVGGYSTPEDTSNWLKKQTGITTQTQVDIVTTTAEANLDALNTKAEDLNKQLASAKDELSSANIQKQIDQVQSDIENQQMTLELMNNIIFEDHGVATEKTTNVIAENTGKSATFLSSIDSKIQGKFDGEQGNSGNTGNTGKPAPTYGEVKQNTFTEPISTKTSFKDSVVMKVDADTGEFDKKVTESNTLADMLNTPRKMPVSASGLNSVNNELSRADRLARVLTGKTHLINFEYRVTGNPPTIPTSTGSGGAKGNAFARGNDIVGEQGRELVVDPNRGIWYTVGDSGTEMIDLPKDAIVYSHNQTEALLKSGVTTRGKSKGRSFANGTEQQYIFGNIDLRHRQPYYWDDGSVSTVLGTSYGMDELSFAVATLLQGNDVRPLGDGEIIWYLEQLVSRSHDPETIYALDRQGFTDPAGNWLHDLIAYVGTDAAYAEYVSSIMHVISDEYERSIGTYARGNAFANGTLVGERGRELIVDPNTGRWYTVGDYGSEMINLPKDAIVYNHQQTEDLLKNGHTGRGHSTGASFLTGNAYDPGTNNNTSESIIGGGNGKSPNSLTLSKASSSAAKSAENAAKAASDAAEKAKDATDEAKNNMIWIDRAIEHQERKVSKINELVEDDFQTYTERLSNLGELREELSLQNEILSDALERRVEEFDKAFQELVEIFGEDVATDLLHKIEVGSVDKDTYKDEFGEDEAGEKKKKALDKVIDAYDEETKLSDKLRDNEKEIRDAVQKEYEFRLNIIEAEKDQLQFEMDTLEHNLDMKDILGRMVTEGDYQDMIDQSEEIADNIERTIDVLEEQLTTVDEGSAKYNEINSQLISAKKELQDIEKQQAEWNEKIMRLPIDRLDKYIGMLENIKKDLQNWISERDTLNITTLGQTIGEQYEIAQEQIEAYQKKEQKYLELIKNYEYGSEKFHETADEIQACQDSVSGLIQEMEELNIQFLKLPIDNITKANEKLQSINSAEQRVLDDYDTALSAVLTLFDKQIERLNDDKDYWDEYYENLIKPEQEKLDLLNEQNEAKQMQYNIDKAQYDLDKARQQKNVQVVRNGRIEYDSDYDAVKNAEDSLANAQHDKVIYDIQQVIDGYEKLNEKKQEELDDEIEAYEDAMNRWQTFEDERTFEKESTEALRLFGEGWEQNIINRTDDREYDIFSKGHIELDRQITANEKQIEANEKMIDLMTRYADAFLSGEMTYEEAVAQYTKLYKDYKSDGALVSQEALAAELAFNNAKDMASALTGNNALTKEQYDSFLGQLEQANTQKQIYEGLQKSWVDMAADIKSQLAELKRLAELAEEIAAQRRSSRRSDSSSGDDGGGSEWSRNPTGYGAHTKYNDSDRTVYVDSGKETSVSASSVEVHAEKMTASSGPASDRSVKTSGKGPASEAFADGLAKGMVGGLNPSEKFKKLQAMGLKALEPDEVPAFLHVGEGVVNSIQQGNILKSVANAFNAGVMSSIPTDAVKSVENNYTFDCQFGDFILPNVEDTNGFASAMKNNFESIMNQQFSKIF